MTPDLQPLFNLINPGEPCEVEYCIDGIPEHKCTFDGAYLLDKSCHKSCHVFSDLSRIMAPRWRLVPPKPLIEWDKRTDDLWVSKCNRFIIHNDGNTPRPWRSSVVKEIKFSFHEKHDQAVAWCEKRAKEMQEAEGGK